MDQPEEILEKLERFNVQKNPEITRELDEYVSFVARTGESVFNWAMVKKLYREKLINVISDFYNETPTKELPQYPNVDPFNYEAMKKMLIERLDAFNAAPFTIQRISELLSDPRKQYSRVDKFMRAVEKNILVVSTVSPSRNRSEESENGDSLDSVGLNGEFSSDVHVDIDMDNDGSFTMTKEFSAVTYRKEPTHDVTAVTHETVKIKKTASNEEEESTSSVAIDTKTGEPLQPTQTEIAVDSQSTVTITVCEPSEEPKFEDNISATFDEQAQQSENNVLEPEQEESLGVIKQDENSTPIISEVVEKVEDQALLNEPLRPAENEILVDTSDIISETTPLAALENIVANRTDPSTIIEVVEPPRIEEPSTNLTESPSVIIEQTEQQKNEDDSGIETKRLKIDDDDVELEPAKIEEVSSDDQEVNQAEPIIQALPEVVENSNIELKSEETKEPIIEEASEQSQTPIDAEPVTETDVIAKDETVQPIEVTEIEAHDDIQSTAQIPIVDAEPIVEESIDEPSPVVAEIIPEIIEAAASTQLEGEMEAIDQPNTMSLDEDDPSSLATISEGMEVTPVTVNKMDTDDNETEMDVDGQDSEMPMDQ